MAMTEKDYPLLFKAKPIWALLEIWITGTLIFVLLVSSYQRLGVELLTQAIFFLSSAEGLWIALRIQIEETRRGWLWDIVCAGLLSTLMTITKTRAAHMLGVVEIFDAQHLWYTVVLLIFGCGIAFAVFRVIIRVWVFWRQLRKRRMLWDLINIQLQLVIVMAILFTIMAMVTTAATQEGPVFDADGWVFTFLPLIGILVVMTGVAVVVVLPPAAILAYFMARNTTRRLESLTTTVRALRNGDYSARITTIEGDDEIAQLQADVNTMSTDLEHAMQDLQVERDKVTDLLKARRELIASVSHELRTPVATIRGYLDSLQSRTGEELSPAVKSDVDIIQREVLQLQRLIEDLFTLSQAEVNGLAMDLQITDIVPIIEQRVATTSSQAWQRDKVQVVAEIEGNIPAIRVDARRLDQVITNLLRNALRHTSPGGIIVVRGHSDTQFVTIEVQDTGEGIPQEEIAQIWERFYRGRSAQEQDRRGAGLGLALVKELTEAMDGTVSVESVIGEGSCFRLQFPK